MSYALCCFNLRGCFGGSSNYGANLSNRRDQNGADSNREPILLDTNYMGHEVVIVKNGIRLCGNGGTIATAPINQNKAYWEIKLQQTGVWGVGLGTRNADLNSAPGGSDKDSWVLCNDGSLRHDKKEIGKITGVPGETISDGDILGMTYDHEELKFYVNNVLVEPAMTGIRGTVYPILFVDEGAILDLCVERLHYTPPSGFDRIMLEQSLL
ncbi:hypothetical protein ONE63_007214 [Megalurothrips usitatus]|uniref:SPRY domain-containing protein 7 n=1 Tax=Megalurothrips usitatus TaxID=439358 RepID=A0AAV7XVE8_9NEOP|nr:hypothetical protein ONE63_007214 [Megalurothrips usitatus]